MADNVVLNLGTGGDTVAADEIAGVKHQRVKIEHGADGSATDVSSASPLPVVQTGTPALPTGAATETSLAAVKTAVEVIDDWDESDRAKVNPIVGQAGVDGGAGAVSAKTVRVAPASDVVAPTSNAAGSQVDGHSLSIGATTDADTALTIIGRLKKLLTQLPAALAAGGGMKVEGVAGGVAQPVSAASLPLPAGASTDANLTALFTALGTLLADGGQLTGLCSSVVASRLVDANTTPPAESAAALFVRVADVAHDSIDAGSPQKVGGKAAASLAGATMVAAADRVNAAFDVDGAQVVRHQCPLGDILSERVTDTGGTSTDLTTFGATASARNHVSTIIAFNDSSTNGFVDIRDGAAGSVIATIPLPAKGGSVIQFPVPLRQPTANTALAFDVSAALTTVYLTFIGFKSKV